MFIWIPEEKVLCSPKERMKGSTLFLRQDKTYTNIAVYDSFTMMNITDYLAMLAYLRSFMGPVRKAVSTVSANPKLGTRTRFDRTWEQKT